MAAKVFLKVGSVGLLLGLMACSFIFVPHFIQSSDSAGTQVGGELSADVEWVAGGSPYVVTSDVVIAQGRTLSIDSGVLVRFATGTALQVDGQLIARGSADAPVIFTSNQPEPAWGDWRWVRFTDTSVDASYDFDGNYAGGSIMEFVTLEFGGDSGYRVVLKIESASPFVNRCNINNNSGGIWVNQGQPRICGNVISNNSYRGILADGTVLIKGNVIENNGPPAEGGGVYARGQVTIVDNVVRGNRASQNGGGIFLYYGPMMVSGNVIENNVAEARKGGGIYSMSESATIEQNSIRGNFAGDGGGFVFAGEFSGEFVRNTVTGNVATSGRGGGIVVDTGGKVNYNNIHDNVPMDFVTSVYSSLDAVRNWWGSADGVVIMARIYDRSEDSNLGAVNYRPYLLSPAGSLFGDIDWNGQVDASDMLGIANDFGIAPVQCALGLNTDLNQDGEVDVFDLSGSGFNFDHDFVSPLP